MENLYLGHSFACHIKSERNGTLWSFALMKNVFKDTLCYCLPRWQWPVSRPATILSWFFPRFRRLAFFPTRTLLLGPSLVFGPMLYPTHCWIRSPICSLSSENSLFWKMLKLVLLGKWPQNLSHHVPLNFTLELYTKLKKSNL